ncbi:hypothetical protein [Variovorax sp. KK3]|uniref:hypothetical protein n=1 Tax=Variovorax sp. KK3 TaxID=1855728 RepID=UPI00097C935F|nr:hypothetical protein [Variovorax sp. KK3]
MAFQEDDLRFARLSSDDLEQVAQALRDHALRGDPAAALVAMAIESVARQRRAAAIVRERVVAARSAWSPLRRAAEWAVSRR